MSEAEKYGGGFLSGNDPAKTGTKIDGQIKIEEYEAEGIKIVHVGHLNQECPFELVAKLLGVSEDTPVLREQNENEQKEKAVT